MLWACQPKGTLRCYKLRTLTLTRTVHVDALRYVPVHGACVVQWGHERLIPVHVCVCVCHAVLPSESKIVRMQVHPRDDRFVLLSGDGASQLLLYNLESMQLVRAYSDRGFTVSVRPTPIGAQAHHSRIA